MKVITICNPYPYLIMLPESDGRHKRVENRTWPLYHRGPLAIHAGKSKAWLEEDEGNPGHDLYGIPLADLVYGAIVGVVDVIASVPYRDIFPFGAPKGLEWLATHEHCSGPHCHVYANPRKLPKPIPWKGAQGLFQVPDDVIAAAFAPRHAEARP